MHRKDGHRAPGIASAGLTAMALVVSAAAVLPGVAHAAPPPPALEYTMEGVDGATVPDTSGNGHDGTLVGETSVTDGVDGEALQLDGGHVEIPSGALPDSSDVTVQTDLRWDGGEDPWQWIFALGTDTDEYLFATPADDDGQLRAAVTNSGDTAEAQVTGHHALPVERWLTVTAVLDSSEEKLTIFVNGLAVNSVETEVSAQDLVDESSSTLGTIGKSFYEDPSFKGAIDGFRIYSDALDADQVAELHQGEIPTLEDLDTDSLEVSTTIGTQPELPSTVPGVYSDGVVRDVPVTWDDIADEDLEEPGILTLAGTAGDREIGVDVEVTRGELQVDLANATGDVEGGASGLLYGLYGEDMPTSNLVEGMNVSSVATKAQDGAQHPGSDALEVLPTLSDADGDVYLRIADYYRGFPYEWPGDTPEERLEDYRRVLDEQLDLIDEIPEDQKENLVIEPFNEPEGNMFGDGEWSLNGTSWLDDPQAFFNAWDDTYHRIKERHPDIRVAGPGMSILFDQTQEFLAHTVEAGTVPEIMTWHELTHPQAIRDSVERYRGWEATAFDGSSYEGTELPININEYAYNYHTSVPGQMIQWISAIEDTKVEAMIAFWNINGNLSDSAVQTNRGNGQWWLYNAYAHMSGQTVEVAPPNPGENYTLQGVASLDKSTSTARVLMGGADGRAPVDLTGISPETFGDSVRVQVREIPWTGQLGDSTPPQTLADDVYEVGDDGTVTLDFGSGDLPEIIESSAYELVVTPGAGAEPREVDVPWSASYEAEDATYEGSGYSLNGPEGSPDNVQDFYTSGGYNVGGLRTGSDGSLTFDVDVPEDGTYDLSVFANSLNTDEAVEDEGPTNVFLTVNGGEEQEMNLPLGYKWVVWDHSETTVDLTAGSNEITLAAMSQDGSRVTQGDAIIDRITLGEASPEGSVKVYEAENSAHDGKLDPAGTGQVSLGEGDTATFWVYGEQDGEATLRAHASGRGSVAVNGTDVLELGDATDTAVHLEGGINKVTVTGEATVDAIEIGAGEDTLHRTNLQAEDAELSGDAEVVELSGAENGTAVDSIGGAPGNDNAATFTVDADSAGRHAVVVRFSNPEQAPASHYNPNPMARIAHVSVNGGDPDKILFVPTFHRNNFWERTIYVDLELGENTIRFGSEEITNFDGDGHISDIWPDYPWLRSDQGPILDRISVQEAHGPLGADGENGEGPGEGPGDGDEPDDEGEDDTNGENDETSGDSEESPGGGEEGGDQGHGPADDNGSADGPGADDGSDTVAGPGATGSGSDSGEEPAQESGSNSDSSLARTGVEVIGLLAVGGALITAGVLLKRRFGSGG